MYLQAAWLTLEYGGVLRLLQGQQGVDCSLPLAGGVGVCVGGGMEQNHVRGGSLMRRMDEEQRGYRSCGVGQGYRSVVSDAADCTASLADRQGSRPLE